MTFELAAESALLGIGLAMDAFSVSLADGLSEPCMKKKKMACIAFCFAAFQFLMPMLGWTFVHTALSLFEVISPYIPWVAFLLLFIIGAKSIREGVSCKDGACECKRLGFGALLLQGVATSIDALSVGFTTAAYGVAEALVSSLIIGGVTFALCLPAIEIGKRFGTKISGKAAILGGVILIIIGLKICIEGLIS
ncbi:MAG: manganese efflux pump [Clostridia bacterium]|nr:manganese efflux pump [Clostridia bacterium]